MTIGPADADNGQPLPELPNLPQEARSGKLQGTEAGAEADRRSDCNRLQSAAILASELACLLHARGVSVYRDPFSPRAEEIVRRAILRADTLGMKQYGPAPATVDEKRDLYQETIEELLDAIFYQTRQIARLNDLRQRIEGVEEAMRKFKSAG